MDASGASDMGSIPLWPLFFTLIIIFSFVILVLQFLRLLRIDLIDVEINKQTFLIGD